MSCKENVHCRSCRTLNFAVISPNARENPRDSAADSGSRCITAVKTAKTAGDLRSAAACRAGWKPIAGCDMIGSSAEEIRHAAQPRATQGVRRRGLSVPARLLLRGGGRAVARGGRGDLPLRPAGGLAGEIGGAAHRLCRAHL